MEHVLLDSVVNPEEETIEQVMYNTSRRFQRLCSAAFCSSSSVLRLFLDIFTVEPRFNEVPRDWANWFVISRVRYIENLVITNLLENNQIVRYIGV